MKANSTKKLVLSSMMIALVFLATYLVKIQTPLPGGYASLGDAVIMLAAVFLGPAGGLIAGSIGSALADLAFGSFLFAPVTFVVKGIEGLVVGILASQILKSNGLKHGRLILAIISGAAIMIAGYFLAEAFVLGAFDEAFGLTLAVAEIPFNAVQGIICAAVGYVLTLVLSKTGIDKYIS